LLKHEDVSTATPSPHLVKTQFLRQLRQISCGIRFHVIGRVWRGVAILKKLAKQRFGQLSTDENDGAFALLIRWPFIGEIKARLEKRLSGARL
jgi:hypothetical protein